MSDLVDVIRRCRVIDVSPLLRPEIPLFPGHPPLRLETARTHEENGYYLQTISLLRIERGSGAPARVLLIVEPPS